MSISFLTVALPSVLAQTSQSEDQGSGTDVESELLQEIDSGIKVTVDRWATGQFGWRDLWLALGIFAGAAFLAYVVRRLIKYSTRQLEGPAAAAMTLIGQVISIGIYLFATALVLEVIGFTLGPVLIIALLAVAVLLILRPIVQNLSSGLILQLRGSCLPGDVVEIAGEMGVVQEINARAVVLTTIDGRTVLLPNDEVIAGKLINHSSGGARRAHMTVRILGGTDVAAVEERVIDSLAQLPGVLTDPAASVQVTGFDGTHMWVAVQFWSDPDPVSQEVARDQVGRALRDLFVADELTLSETTITIAGQASGANNPIPGGR